MVHMVCLVSLDFVYCHLVIIYIQYWLEYIRPRYELKWDTLYKDTSKQTFQQPTKTCVQFKQLKHLPGFLSFLACLSYAKNDNKHESKEV